MSTTTPVPPAPCPCCGTELDAATGPTGVQPRPGNLTVCLYCGGLLVFGPRLSLSVADRQGLTAEQRAQLGAVETMVAHAKARARARMN